jgi:hypothetical protein
MEKQGISYRFGSRRETKVAFAQDKRTLTLFHLSRQIKFLPLQGSRTYDS